MTSRSSLAVAAVAGSLLVASASTAWAAADLRVAKTADRDPAIAGGLLTYTLTVTNDGPDAATNVTLVDTLPPAVAWVSDDCAGGPPVGQVVTCALGSIAATTSVAVQVTVVVSPAAQGAIVNSATVAASESDPDQADNVVSLLSQVSTGAIIKSGSANHVGLTPPDGIGDANVRVRGSFTVSGAVDLLGSTLTLEELLAENGAGGAGELVTALGGNPLLPLTLTARRSLPTTAIYQTPNGARPSIRVQVRERPRGSRKLEFDLNLKRAVIPGDPLLCVELVPGETPETTLTTRFRLTGPGVNRQITGTASWKCVLDDPDNKMRVHSGSSSSGAGGGEPDASLRTEMLTSQPGPDQVQLDGSQSEDKAPGFISAYEFWVVDRDSNAVVAGPIIGTQSVVVVTLPPGDYRAHLTVTDNDGLTDTTSRGLSVK